MQHTLAWRPCWLVGCLARTCATHRQAFMHWSIATLAVNPGAVGCLVGAETRRSAVSAFCCTRMHSCARRHAGRCALEGGGTRTLHPTMQGRVFAWIDRMLSAQPVPARLADWGPPKEAVARSALTNLLQARRLASPCSRRAGVLAANAPAARGSATLLRLAYPCMPACRSCQTRLSIVVGSICRATATWPPCLWTPPMRPANRWRQDTSRSAREADTLHGGAVWRSRAGSAWAAACAAAAGSLVAVHSMHSGLLF